MQGAALANGIPDSCAVLRQLLQSGITTILRFGTKYCA
jgi:hypothetical protein